MATTTKVANCPFAISMFGIIWPLHRLRSIIAYFRLTSGLTSGPWKCHWTYWKTKETESVYKFCVTMVEMRDQYLLGEDSNQFIGDVIANTFSCTNNKPITSGKFSKSIVITCPRSFLARGQFWPIKGTRATSLVVKGDRFVTSFDNLKGNSEVWISDNSDEFVKPANVIYRNFELKYGKDCPPTIDGFRWRSHPRGYIINICRLYQWLDSN